jgi:hypothetical protein
MKNLLSLIIGLILSMGFLSGGYFPDEEYLPMGIHKVVMPGGKKVTIITNGRKKGKTENEKKEEEKMWRSLDLLNNLIIDIWRPRIRPPTPYSGFPGTR